MIVTFDGFNEKQKEVEEYKQSILKLIDEFVTTDIEFQKNPYRTILKPYKGADDFFINIKGTLIVDYQWSYPYLKSDQFAFNKLEYERLQKFMKDPELYRNNKKFNI